MMNRFDYGRKYIQLKGPLKIRIDVRNLIISLIVAAVILVLAVFALSVGTLHLSVNEVFSVLTGETTGIERTVVLEWRLPRVLVAIVCGAALAVSGSIFQSITKNPLGSPDIIGFSTGSYTGVLVVLLVLKINSYTSIALGALIGGFATAILIYFLAFRNGIQGFRLIIVGIAIATILSSVNAMLLLQSKTEAGATAAAWEVGSLNGVDWEHSIPAMILVLILLMFAFALRRPLRELELGEDTAKSHGIHITRTQAILIFNAVALTAASAALIGPVAFVALAAPQIAIRFTKSGGSFVPVAAVGSLLLLAADILAQRMIPGTILPVGVVTLSFGGIYLVWLLFKQARSGS